METADEVARVAEPCIENPDQPSVHDLYWSNDRCDLKTQADANEKLLQAKVIKAFL